MGLLGWQDEAKPRGGASYIHSHGHHQVWILPLGSGEAPDYSLLLSD